MSYHRHHAAKGDEGWALRGGLHPPDPRAVCHPGHLRAGLQQYPFRWRGDPLHPLSQLLRPLCLQLAERQLPLGHPRHAAGLLCPAPGGDRVGLWRGGQAEFPTRKADGGQRRGPRQRPRRALRRPGHHRDGQTGETGSAQAVQLSLWSSQQEQGQGPHRRGDHEAPGARLRHVLPLAGLRKLGIAARLAPHQPERGDHGGSHPWPDPAHRAVERGDPRAPLHQKRGAGGSGQHSGEAGAHQQVPCVGAGRHPDGRARRRAGHWSGAVPQEPGSAARPSRGKGEAGGGVQPGVCQQQWRRSGYPALCRFLRPRRQGHDGSGARHPAGSAGGAGVRLQRPTPARDAVPLPCPQLAPHLERSGTEALASALQRLLQPSSTRLRPSPRSAGRTKSG